MVNGAFSYTELMNMPFKDFLFYLDSAKEENDRQKEASRRR